MGLNMLYFDHQPAGMRAASAGGLAHLSFDVTVVRSSPKPTKLYPSKNLLRFAPLFVLSYALVACGSDNTRSGMSAAGVSPVAACAERGIAYFRKIRSYPTLHSPPNSGRSAEAVALERCKLDQTAF